MINTVILYPSKIKVCVVSVVNGYARRESHIMHACEHNKLLLPGCVIRTSLCKKRHRSRFSRFFELQRRLFGKRRERIASVSNMTVVDGY